MNTASPPRTEAIGVSLILLLALLTALDAMAIDMYLPGMPAIAADFGTSAGDVQQTLAIFLAGIAIGQGLYGPLLDRYGRRLPLLIGIGVFVVGSVLAALAPSMEWLLAARFLQALGAAAGLVAPRAIVADLCTLAESARILTVLMQVMLLAPIVAPILGGWLILGPGGWRLTFWVMAALGIAGLLWGLRTIPDSLPPGKRVPLAFGNILGGFGHQLRQPVFMAYALASGFILGSLFVYISMSAFVFTAHFGLSPVRFTYVFAACAIAQVLAGALSGFLLKRGMAAGRIMTLGIAAHVLAALALWLLVRAGVAGLALYIGLLALSVGALGLVFGNLTALTMAQAGRQAGVASALMGMLQYLMAAVVGYLASLAPQGPALLPLALACCGVLALLLCSVAARMTPSAFPLQAP